MGEDPRVYLPQKGPNKEAANVNVLMRNLVSLWEKPISSNNTGVNGKVKHENDQLTPYTTIRHDYITTQIQSGGSRTKCKSHGRRILRT